MNAATRALWLALMIFFSLTVGVVAGVLAWAGGVPVPVAVLTAGAAFGGTLPLLLSVFRFATTREAGAGKDKADQNG